MARPPRKRRKQTADSSIYKVNNVVRTPLLDDSKSLCLTVAVFLLHGAGLVFLFEPLTGIFASEPIIEQDWGLHFHHLAALESFWRKDGVLWGYNPFFMAGYPSNNDPGPQHQVFRVCRTGSFEHRSHARSMVQAHGVYHYRKRALDRLLRSSEFILYR